MAAETDAPIETTALDSVRAAFERIDAAEPTVHAFVALDREAALSRAAALDAAPAQERGPLHGVPFAVKEVIDRRGRPAAWGSRVKAGRIGERDAAVIERLLAAGAVPVGETVSTEYAIAAVGPTRNPHDPRRTPGASSQGSAAAVGGGLVPFALGTQTIGSIVRPASYCGAVGFKPRRGAIDRSGTMALAPSFDSVGVIAESVPLAAQVAEAAGATLGEAAPRRVLRLDPWFPAPMIACEVEEALDAVAGALRTAGLPLFRLRLPEIVAGREADVIQTILAYEVAQLYGAEIESHGRAMSPILRALLEEGLRIEDDVYREALATGRHIAAAIAAELEPGDVLLCHSVTGPPPPFGQDTGPREPQRLWSLVDWPAVTVPALWRDGLPVGVQLVAQPGEDRAALIIAERVMRSRAEG